MLKISVWEKLIPKLEGKIKYALACIYNFGSASRGDENRFDSVNADILRTAQVQLKQKPHDGTAIFSPKTEGLLCIKALQSVTE